MTEDASVIIVLTLILTLLGLIVGYSVEGVKTDLQAFLEKQFIILCIGFALFFMMLFSDYHNLFKPKFFWLISLLCIMGLVLVLFIGEEKNGAKRCIQLIGGFSIQPSEFARIAVLVNITWYLSRFYDKLSTFFFGIVFPLLLAGIYCSLIFLENDQGIPMVILTTVLCMMFVAGIQKKYVFLGGVGLIVVFILGVITKPHRIDRIIFTIFPELDPSGKGWHIIQSLGSFYRGSVLGVGIGAGEQKLGYLPEAHRDFPFSIIGEEMGLLGAVLVVLLFFLLVFYGFEIARKSKDIQGSLLAMGITCMMGIQALVMMMVNLGLLPIKGMCLPLVSSGGSSFISTMFLLGCLVNISLYGEHEKSTESKWALIFPLSQLNNKN